MNKPSNGVLLIIFIVIVLLVVIAFFVKTKRYNANGNGLVGGLGEGDMEDDAESVMGTGHGITQFLAKSGRGMQEMDDDYDDVRGFGPNDSDDERCTNGYGSDEEFGGAFEDIYGSGKSLIVGLPVFKALSDGDINSVIVPNLPFTKGINIGTKVTVVKAKPKDGSDSPKPWRAKATVKDIRTFKDGDVKFNEIIKECDGFTIVPKTEKTKNAIEALFDEFKANASKGRVVIMLENFEPVNK